jgi:hypothetical protein
MNPLFAVCRIAQTPIGDPDEPDWDDDDSEDDEEEEEEDEEPLQVASPPRVCAL